MDNRLLADMANASRKQSSIAANPCDFGSDPLVINRFQGIGGYHSEVTFDERILIDCSHSFVFDFSFFLSLVVLRSSLVIESNDASNFFVVFNLRAERRRIMGTGLRWILSRVRFYE